MVYISLALTVQFWCVLRASGPCAIHLTEQNSTGQQINGKVKAMSWESIVCHRLLKGQAGREGSSWQMKRKSWIHLFCVFLPLGQTLAVIIIEICLLFCQFELIKEYNDIILCSFHLDSEKKAPLSYCFTLDWLFPGKEVLLNHTKIVCAVSCSIAVLGRIRLWHL